MMAEQKQIRIEQLIFDYFRGREDTEIRYASTGLYEVALRSVSVQQAFNGRKKLQLVFTQQAAIDNPDSEFISSGHPYLDVIRNDLMSESTVDPRLSEVYVAANLLSQTASIRVPGVEFTDDSQKVNADLSFTLTLILTYKVVYDTDERLENIVRLCWDPSKTEMRPDLLERSRHVAMVSGVPQGFEPRPEVDIESVLNQGRKEIEARVATDLTGIHADVLSRLTGDRERLERHYNSQLDALPEDNEVDRQHILNQLAKDTKELEDKYQMHVNVQLLSIMKLWWPEISYHVHFPGKHGNVSIDPIRYSAKELETDIHPCPRCGNRQKFHVCHSGSHMECGGSCDHGMKRCSICQDTMCVSHAHICASCGQDVCHYDDDICTYGQHGDAVFCDRCLTFSFEDKPICPSCKTDCDVCSRHFDRQHTGVCYLTDRVVCLGHDREPCGLVCNECDRIVARTRAVQVTGGGWVCDEDTRIATCCDRIFGRSRVTPCTLNASELLCPDHAIQCMGCQETVCSTHSYPLAKVADGRVCQRCDVHCEHCDSDLHYRPVDLVRCVDCGQQVCVDHRKACAVCGKPVCDNHVLTSRNGEALCRQHVGVCHFCPPEDNRHRSTSVAVCVECGQQCCTEHTRRCAECGDAVCIEHGRISAGHEVLCKRHAGECAYCPPNRNIHRMNKLAYIAGNQSRACADHRVLCPTCEQTFLAKPLLNGYVRCAGCGRMSCRTGQCTPTYRICAYCGQAYCRNCFTENQCTTCASIRHAQRLSNWPDLPRALTRVAQMQPDTAELIGKMLEHPDWMFYKAAKNNSYQIIVFQCNMPLLNRLFGHDRDVAQKQLRIAFDGNHVPVHVRVEPADKD